jgi:putative solute:sodium symporter small subunit
VAPAPRKQQAITEEEYRGMAQKLDSVQMQRYWSKTSRLMWTIFALWLFFSFVVHLFAVQLNKIVILGFPLGFYMAAQGSLIAFVVLCTWNAISQNRIDEEFGVQED